MISAFRLNCLLILSLFSLGELKAQPNWPAIKSTASFTLHDTAFNQPQIQAINVGGWEDGLYMTRDGKQLFSTYLPIDVISWLGDFTACIDFNPYFRPPLLGIDTLSNPFNCPNYMHSDIIRSSRSDTAQSFSNWSSSNLQTPATFEGGVCGVQLNADSFDTFIFTRDIGAPNGMELFLLQQVPVNPTIAGATAILSSPAHEDNPHIERLNDSTLLLLFDRDRSIYYSISQDNGQNWQSPVLVSQVLNDQAPYDVQPHLWHDGNDWWVYFCADNQNGIRCIYKSKQQVINDWDSWGPRQLVLEPNFILAGGLGNIFGIGEPSLTAWGDLSFVVVYGDLNSNDTNDVYDCDPWLMKRKNPLPLALNKKVSSEIDIQVFPNPSMNRITLKSDYPELLKLKIYNLQGRLMLSKVFQTQSTVIVEDWPAGVYFAVLEGGRSTAIKFIVN